MATVTAPTAKAMGFTETDAPPRSIIDRCVQCGFCLPTCPTYQLTFSEASSPRGRIHLLRAVSDGRLDLRAAVVREQMDQCLNCRACEAVCPSGVQYGQLVEPARAQMEQAHPRPLWQRMFRTFIFVRVFGDMRVFRLASGAIALYQHSGLRTLVRRTGMLKLLGLDKQDALLPEVPLRFVIPSGQRWQPQGSPRHHVGLFTGCIMSTAFAPTDEATARVLARNGCEVVAVPDQGCCGALALHAGEAGTGRENAKRNIVAFERLELDAIIVNAAGCGAALKEYRHLFHGDPEWSRRAERFSAAVRDVSEFLDTLDLVPPGHLDRVVTYQEPCHLAHAQRITAAPRRLLAKIPGVRLVEMEESSLCCGSAGIYNVIRPEFSRRLLERKLKNALQTEADTIISANPGCIMQVASGLREQGKHVRVLHIVDLLDEAYRSA
ncbi:MAG: heterodisulfide reductase-related iron-sulfur binding cluster [Chloroflexi bacterium]|nr:heterodisulfide reductase-related iron-sulfur binding cluster [Chloroflexota bacterium]